MKHSKKGKKFGKEKDQRKMFMKGLGESLIFSKSIIITEARAKELRSFIEKKITIAKKGGVNSIRKLRKIFSEKSSKKLIKEIATDLKERNGGYTRITKIGIRKTDGAKMAKIEIIGNNNIKKK